MQWILPFNNPQTPNGPQLSIHKTDKMPFSSTTEFYLSTQVIGPSVNLLTRLLFFPFPFQSSNLLYISTTTLPRCVHVHTSH